MSIQPYGGHLSESVLQALCEDKADFSGAEGSYKIIQGLSPELVTVEKVKSVAVQQTLVSGLAEKSKNEIPISWIVQDLSEEANKVISLIRDRLINGEKVDVAKYKISSVQKSTLENLKALVDSPDLRERIDRLEERLDALNSPNPSNLVLEYAIETGELNLAIWALEKGADAKLLENPPKTRFSAEAINWLKKRAEKVEYNPESLKHYAIDVGLGYKTTNLKVMEAQLAKAREGLSSEVHVPPLLGISDFEMWSVLKEGIPDLESDWEKFLQSFDTSMKESFVQAPSAEEAKKVPMQITREGEEVLKKIEKKISAYLSDKNIYSSPLLKEWLKTINPVYVIVRSTGKEDSDIAANAGGNESVPFVLPNEEAISKAIGVVVGSYFGRKSVIQRLQAGDKTVFTEKPFLPVLIQEMVCEPFVGGIGSGPLDIPRSGVLFTKQPGRADGVVVINAALGSNEGVVSSQVVVDTYSVHAKGVYSINRDKDIRFVQQKSGVDGKITVGPIKNSDEKLRRPPAINSELAQELALLATRFGNLYGKGSVKPMDMEFTITFKRSEDLQGSSSVKAVIYPLQIRPLLSKQELNPSFLKLDRVKTLSAGNQIKASTLLSGDCSTRVIDDPAEQVLFADDLPQALNKYQHLEDPGKIRLIITRKTAPLTSHEAVTFSQMNIPIMPIEDSENYLKARKLMGKATEETPCYADPQRALIVFGEGEPESELIGKGLISYPSPREYSVPFRDFSCLNGETPRERAERLANLALKSQQAFNSRFRDRAASALKLKSLSVSELLDKAAMGDTEEAKDALVYLVYNRLGSLVLKSHAKEIKEQIVDGDLQLADDALKDLVSVYEEIVHLLETDIFPAVEKYPPSDMNRLFFLKPLESLILQEGTFDVQNSNSIKSVLDMRRHYPSLSEIHEKYKIDLGRDNTWLICMGKKGYRKVMRENWYKFVGSIDKTQKKKLMEDLQRLQELGVDELFINVFFQRYWDAHQGDVKKVYEQLLKTIRNESGNLDWLESKQISIKTLEGQVGNWGVPSYAEKRIPRLNEKIADLGLINADLTPSKEFFSRYQRATPFARLALLSYASRVISCYDESVKSLSGSTLFESDNDKAKYFAAILKPYHAMMETMMQLPSDESKRILMMDEQGDCTVGFYDYKKGLSEGRIYLHQDLFERYAAVTQYEDWKSKQPETIVPGQGYGSTEFFKSRGFQSLCQAASRDFAGEDVKMQFAVRDYFNVDAFVPGARIDRMNKLYWPSRLEEYFTTFHQTMEAIVKHELTQNGVKADILPEELKSVCESFGRELGVESPSSIVKHGEDIIVSYDVPLRQHAAKVKFTMNAHKSNTPISMEVKVFGGDEADRFKRSAALAALIAHLNKPDIRFHNSIPPQINYESTDGVSFTLDFSRDYIKIPQLMERMRVLIKDNTMVDDPAKLKSEEQPSLGQLSMPALYDKFVVRGGLRIGYGGTEVKQFGEYLGMKEIDDWKKVPEQFFADSLYLNLYLFDRFAEKKDYEMVERIVKKSREGLQQYGLKDYTGKGITRESEMYKSHFLPHPSTSSLVIGMKAGIEHLLLDLKEQRTNIKKEVKSLENEVAELVAQLSLLEQVKEGDLQSQPKIGKDELELKKKSAEEKMQALSVKDSSLEIEQARLEGLL